MLSCGVNLSFALSLLLLSSFFAAFILDYNTYQRLTREHAVAAIEFHNLGPQHFQAILTESNNPPIFLQLHGDQWQLDARLIKWKGAAAWAGLKPMYRLERVSGRYQNIQLEKDAIRSIYALDQGYSPSFWNFLIDYQGFIPWLDAYYGNATYLPMAHGAKFNINITASGLVARPDNEVAKNSLQHWLAPI